MGDDEDLRTQVMEQALAIDELRQTTADAEERRQKSHAELLGMMETLLQNSRERETRASSGGQLLQRSPRTAGAVGRATASLSLGFPDGDSGSQEGVRAPAEPEPSGAQSGGRGLAPNRESLLTHGGLGRQLLGQT